MKWIGCVVAAAVLLIAPASLASNGEPVSKRGCSTINLGGPRVFTKHNMKCDKAQQKARRVYESRGAHEPRNFSCSSGSNFQEGGFCQHDSKDKYFGWHPGD